MFYELTTLKLRLGSAPTATPAIESWVKSPDAKGRLLGAWAADIGRLNEIFLLRGFETLDELNSERERTRRSDNPFGCADALADWTMDSYSPLSFIPPVETGDFGPFYEIRTYVMKPNGLEQTEERWRNAVPTRSTYSPLTVAMYSIDGGARFTHIWPYRSLDERHNVRKSTVADGIWPPKGGPDWLTQDMTSTICLPLPFSPLK